MSEVVEKIDEMIGRKFGQAQQLEVTEWDGTRGNCKYGKKMYTLRCSVCEKDKEMFGGQVFRSTKADLKRGWFPCGCGKNVKWKPWQFVIRVQRQCAIKRYKFNGFYGNWRGNKTRVLLECLDDGNVWHTTMCNFFNGRGCPKCAKYGYDASNIEGYVYVLKVMSNDDDKGFTGFGITKSPEDRLKKHRAKLTAKGFSITDLTIFKTTGKIALSVETKIKYTFKIEQQTVDGFVKEATSFQAYSSVLDFVRGNVPSVEYYHLPVVNSENQLAIL